MAGEVLGRRVEHDVGPQAERPLERRRGERVVDHDQRPAPALGRPPPHGLHGRRDVHQLEMRIGRALEPDQPGPLRQRLPERVLARGEIDVPGVHALAPVHPLEVAERAAVDVVADHDLVARPGQVGDRGGRRRPRGEGDPGRAALEPRDGPLQAFAGRVLRAGVLVPAPRPRDAVLGEGGGLVDRRRDRAGQLVGLGAGMDGQRVEGVRRGPRHPRRHSGIRAVIA